MTDAEENAARLAYSYLRFSSPSQAKGDSLRRQLARAQTYAEQHDLVLDQSLNFRDLGVSAFRGLNANVGKLAEFVHAVDEGLVPAGSYLLVESLDRISRDRARHAFRLLESLCDRGITVVTLADGHEYTQEVLDRDPVALLMSIVYFMRANDESEMRSIRISASWHERRKNAAKKKVTTVGPSWLKFNKETGEFDVIEEKAEVIRRIFQLTIEGWSQTQIARAFNREGLPTISGRGTAWTRVFVSRILRQTTVIGTYTPKFKRIRDGKATVVPLEPIENYYPAVVSRQVYDEAEALRLTRIRAPWGPFMDEEGKAHPKRHLGFSFSRNVLGSLCVCPKCGWTMSRYSSSHSQSSWQGSYLICTKARDHAGCELHGVRYEIIERALLTRFHIIEQSAPTAENDLLLSRQLDEVTAKLEANHTRLNNLTDLIEATPASSALMERLNQAETERRNLLLEERQLKGRSAGLSSKLVSRWLNGARELIDQHLLDGQKLERNKLNRILRQLFNAVTVDYENCTLVFEWHFIASTSLSWEGVAAPLANS